MKLTNRELFAFIAPAQGGQIYELDIRSICHNLGATLTRRPEDYHRKVLAGQNQDGSDCASIHDRVVFKQEGLNERVHYDSYYRKTLVDHFYGHDVSAESLLRSDVQELGDFVEAPYEAKIRRSHDRIQVQMTRDGHVQGRPLRITKGVTLETDSSTLEIAYLLEDLPPNESLHFGVEFNLAGLPSGADDRYFSIGEDRLGHLGSTLNLSDQHSIEMTDEWLGLQLRLSADQPTGFWTFPIETVSQSEGGFELVHQSVVVHPHWLVQGDANGRWSVLMKLEVDSSLAKNRMLQGAVATVE